MESSKDTREKMEDAIHLAAQIVNDHFGSIPEIREEHQDREEVEYQKDLKRITYEIILKKLIKA